MAKKYVVTFDVDYENTDPLRVVADSYENALKFVSKRLSEGRICFDDESMGASRRIHVREATEKDFNPKPRVYEATIHCTNSWVAMVEADSEAEAKSIVFQDGSEDPVALCDDDRVIFCRDYRTCNGFDIYGPEYADVATQRDVDEFNELFDEHVKLV